jgi:hypothetical protein
MSGQHTEPLGLIMPVPNMIDTMKSLKARLNVLQRRAYEMGERHANDIADLAAEIDRCHGDLDSVAGVIGIRSQPITPPNGNRTVTENMQ